MGIKQVAVEAGVSVTTASRALSGEGRVGAETRARVLDVAHRLGYQPDEVARQLRRGSTATLAVLVPDIRNPFFPELVKGVQDAASRHGRLLQLAQTGDDPELTLQLLAQLRRHRIEGVVLDATELPDEGLEEVLAGLPVVCVDRAADLPGAAVVRSDQRTGGRLATEHLVALGHERIAHLAGPLHLDVARQRLAGHHDALEAAGLPVDPELVVEATFSEDAGREAVAALLARRARFTAVFAGNDLMAIGALRGLDDAGLRVPRDVSVVGFDDIHLASYVRPGLTTVRQETYELGRLAVETLLELSTGDAVDPLERVLPTTLVRRGTTARPQRERSAGGPA